MSNLDIALNTCPHDELHMGQLFYPAPYYNAAMYQLALSFEPLIKYTRGNPNRPAKNCLKH
jgi:hypothetical protein